MIMCSECLGSTGDEFYEKKRCYEISVKNICLYFCKNSEEHKEIIKDKLNFCLDWNIE